MRHHKNDSIATGMVTHASNLFQFVAIITGGKITYYKSNSKLQLVVTR